MRADQLDALRIARICSRGGVNDAERANTLAKMGVDWIITDDPRAIVARLRPPRVPQKH